MAEPSVVYYRADGADAYAAALVVILRHARETTDDFTFGPLRLSDLERDGLQIGGPDLGALMTALASVPGLAQVDG